MTKMVKALILVVILTTTLAVRLSPAQACACGVPDWSTMSDEEIVSTINNEFLLSTMLRMNLGLWPERVESFHLLRMDADTMSTTG